MSHSDPEAKSIREEDSIEAERRPMRSSSQHEEPWTEAIAMEDSPYTREVGEIRRSKCSLAFPIELPLTCAAINRHMNLICGLSNRVSELEKQSKIAFDLLRSVANVVSALEVQKDATGQAIKELQDEVVSLKRVRDETVDYVDERAEDKIRTFGNFRNSCPREGKIKLEVTIGGNYGEEN